jgi:hypothetical protein
MPVKRIPEWLLVVFALPAYQIWNIAKYANIQQGWPAKIGMALTFLPAFAITTTIWGGVWSAALWLVWHAVK